MSETRRALNSVRRLITAMAPEGLMCINAEEAAAYRRGYDSAKVRAMAVLDLALAAYPETPHQWVPAIGTDTATGEPSALPFNVCAQCRRRSDTAAAVLPCEPLTREMAAQWAAVDASFAEAQQQLRQGV